jgi:hypothetical protein
MPSLLLDKKMNRASDELNYMECNIFREGQPLIRRPGAHEERGAAPDRAAAADRRRMGVAEGDLQVRRELINSEWSADVRFGAHSGLIPDIT